MSCDFKVGDEVVCVDASSFPDEVLEGPVYVVSEITAPGWAGDVGIRLEGVASVWDWPGQGYWVGCFRKVQRRDLTAWLATENTIEGPLRTKEHAR